MSVIQAIARKLNQSEAGQDAAEYAILIGFIAILIVAAVALLGTGLSTTYSNITSAWVAAIP